MTPEEMKRFFGQNNSNGKSDQNKSLLNRMKKMTGAAISEKELELFKRLIPKSK